MNISIFGLGYVGCVSLGCLAKNGHTVVGVDINTTKVNQINSGRATIVEKDIDTIIAEQFEQGRIRASSSYYMAVMETDLSIIAVGTPSTEKGHLNLSYLFSLADRIGNVLQEKDSFHVLAIRSTVMPGTCEQIAARIESKTGKVRNVDFAVVSNPEFLREGTAVHDYYNPPLTIIGTESEKAEAILRSIYEELPGQIVVTSTKTAEIMKFVNNTFHAMKISFANEVGNICSSLSIDSHQVMNILCQDTQLNISDYYLKPGFAYGGSCLPKDLKGLQMLAHDLYLQVPLINSINQTNEIQKQRAIALLMKYSHRKIGFLGIGFKAGTDDLRNSPAVELVESLMGRGFAVKVYDRNIQISKLTGANKEFIDQRIPHLAQCMAEEGRELLDWSDVLVICTKENEFTTLMSSAYGKTVIDLVNLPFDNHSSNQYFGINWSSGAEASRAPVLSYS
ncbi:nucleotide sugar dehydrogenase [Larkinella terrae]|uniref:UDP-glucose 6-dehydrogenase n=1 Tax=Larkinella terrae TaxID=2025311 RepID=A0A7K0EUQ4_9BACT|nr:UDP-glucose/GDP-mannose dehydrogenase family protein [Larkinella terrae]MRS65540.1 nucleotide sugar dehydrogenase [Larkinella terrae]